jgi:hypothetical protein
MGAGDGVTIAAGVFSVSSLQRSVHRSSSSVMVALEANPTVLSFNCSLGAIAERFVELFKCE